MWVLPFHHLQVCFSCYAVVAVQLLEFEYARQYRPMRFSVRQVVDCTPWHCQGGTMEDTMEFMRTRSVVPEHVYRGQCDGVGVRVAYEIETATPERIRELLKQGPVGVGHGDHMDVLLGYDGEWVYANRRSAEVGSHVVRVTDVIPYI